MTELKDDDFFSDDVGSTSTNENTRAMIKAFKDLREAEKAAAMLSAQLEGEAAVVSKLKTDTIPEILKEMGTELWRDPETGILVELVTAVNSSLPKDVDKRNAILDALRPLGIEQIMAEEFTIQFSPNDKRAHAIRAIIGLENPGSIFEDEADVPRLTNEQMDLVQRLRESLDLNDLPASEKLGVHPARLKSWLTELIGKGHGETIRDAGIWHGKHAKVTEPKGSRK